MDESALEKYFDRFIANEKVEEEEVEEEEEVTGDELFFSLLPDELLTVNTDRSTCVDYSSHNPTAGLPDKPPVLDQEATVVHPSAPMMAQVPEPRVLPQIQNVVSRAHLGCRLDLDLLVGRLWDVVYKPKVYRAVVMRIRKPRTTAMVYESGSIACVGAQSTELSQVAIRKFARKIQKLGLPVRLRDFRVGNVVASCSTFPLSLELLSRQYGSSYEPELFPALHCKVSAHVTATIFSSGKISLLGAKNEAEIYEAFDMMYPVLSICRR